MSDNYVEIGFVLEKLKALKIKSNLWTRIKKVYLENPTLNRGDLLLPELINLDRDILDQATLYLEQNEFNRRTLFEHLVKNIGRAPEPEELPEKLVSIFCHSLATGSSWTERLRKPLPEFKKYLLECIDKNPKVSPTDVRHSRICEAILKVIKFTKDSWPECFPYLRENGYQLRYPEVLETRVRSSEEWLRDLFLEYLSEKEYNQIRNYPMALALEYIHLVKTKLPWLEELILKNRKVFEGLGLMYVLDLMDAYPVKPVIDL